MTFKTGDRVQRKLDRPASAYTVGHEPFVVQGVRRWDGWVIDQYGMAHDLDNVEAAPEPLADWGRELLEGPREFQVGDTVRLTGKSWGGYGRNPRGGDEVQITDVIDGYARVGSGYIAYREGQKTRGSDTFESWGAELVQAYTEPEDDATGYPPGTPRAAKNIPETSQIKGNIRANNAEHGYDPAAELAEFNRWYERELNEAREEGRAEGYAQGADEGHTEGYLHGLNAAAQGIVDNLLKGVPGVG